MTDFWRGLLETLGAELAGLVVVLGSLLGVVVLFVVWALATKVWRRALLPMWRKLAPKEGTRGE